MGILADRFASIAKEVDEGRAPTETVRNILRWLDPNAKRRSYIRVAMIRDALAAASLTTDPDIEAPPVDSEVSFRKAEVSGSADAAAGSEVGFASVADAVVEGDEMPAAYADPTHRISRLTAANRKPVSVVPDTTLKDAVTLMLQQEFSQLPVMTGEREVKGHVSWRTIAERLALGQTGTYVREFMKRNTPIVQYESSLFDAIASIAHHDFVLVRMPDQRVGGIVTADDLSKQFRVLAEPFLLLGEIENHIRRVLHKRLDDADLTSASDGNYAAKPISSVADLSFGDYVRLLQKPEKWDKVALPVDQKHFVSQIDEVRQIRNDVMHFDPDGVPSEDLDRLRHCSRFLQNLREIGVAD